MSEEKNNLICPECKSIEIYYENPKTGNGLYNCEECGFAGNENIFIMTNGDKIRHMSDDELNKKLCDVWESGYKNGKKAMVFNMDMDVSYIDWLESKCES